MSWFIELLVMILAAVAAVMFTIDIILALRFVAEAFKNRLR